MKNDQLVIEETRSVPNLGLKLWPDPILRQKALPVTEFGPELNNIIIGMTKLMNAAEGAGLAGPQAGLLKRIVVWRIDNEEGFWINPEIISTSEFTQTLSEGCLSFPTVVLGVKRSQQVTVKYQDAEGNFQERVCFGPMAQMAQHEIEHLDGIVFTKNLSRLKRDIVDRKMTKYKKKIMEIRKQYEQLYKQQLRKQLPGVQLDVSAPAGVESKPATSAPAEPGAAEYDFSIKSESV